MTPGARIQAAIEILEDLAANPRPADKAVREWGAAHRFAGSKDRAGVRDLVFAAFRRRGEVAEIMGTDEPRALIIGGARLALGWSRAELAAALSGGKYSATALSQDESIRLNALGPRLPLEGAINWPAWLREKLAKAHGEAAEPLMSALIESAPLDLRVNSAAAERESALAALASVGFPAEATPFSPWGIRIVREESLAGANIRALPMFRSGTIEIQDEGSQLAVLLSGAAPGEQILELCAGGGGKTLALGAMTGRSGQIFACDIDEARLKAGQERARRAGLHNVQPRAISPWDPQSGGADPDLETFAAKMDLVVLDVPCTGSGAWRRAPDAKWRLTSERFAHYIETQAALLRRGARLVKPGGRLLYVTCSLFAEENAEQIARFLGTPQEGRGFVLSDLAAMWREKIGAAPPQEALVPIRGAPGKALQLSPITTHTDGFFVALLERVQP